MLSYIVVNQYANAVTDLEIRQGYNSASSLYDQILKYVWIFFFNLKKKPSKMCLLIDNLKLKSIN